MATKWNSVDKNRIIVVIIWVVKSLFVYELSSLKHIRFGFGFGLDAICVFEFL